MIRAATPTDAPAICAIWNPVIRGGLETFTTEEKTFGGITAVIREAPCFIVSEDAEGVTGFATFGQLRGGPGYARSMEHSVYVAPRAYGRGIGRALVEEIAGHAQAGGARSLWAACSGGSPNSIAFHARIGFEQVAVLESVGFKQGQWLDLVLLRRWLSPQG
ncbi:N-acetyltransferase [Alphaproteobacteria bacterium KMM 3653]|uniref:N-acetyltransferase n=1 Tax=Harenicola maris TaxID=2841044 RepID=A0AAP2G725_9RHOB|nr:N-acetyltransferase [Harenicola maris]